MDQHKKYKDWIVGEDEVGAAILKWRVDAVDAYQETDPLARTYNFLKRLEVPDLALQDDPVVEGFDPYDSGVYAVRRRPL